MYLKFGIRHIVLFLAVLVLLFTSGCGSSKKALPQKSTSGFSVRSGKMLHVKQVLEHYDASGQVVPQYFELWLVDKKGLCVELDRDGNETGRILDTDDMHIAYDPKTSIAVKHDFSRIFILNFESLRSSSSDMEQADDQRYAGRICAIYLLENDDSEEWIKVYVDRETGYVLLCNAPLFRISTALFEVLPKVVPSEDDPLAPLVPSEEDPLAPLEPSEDDPLVSLVPTGDENVNDFPTCKP